MDLVLRFAVCGLYGTILERSELTWLKCKKDLCAPFAKCKAHTCHLALKCLWFMFYSLILFLFYYQKILPSIRCLVIQQQKQQKSWSIKNSGLNLK